MSVYENLTYGSTNMDPIADILKSPVCSSIGQLVLGLRDKPLIRCEKCIKTPKEIGDNAKFMQCSVCKTKLKSSVHYCSRCVLSRYVFPSHLPRFEIRACQKDDWQEHKKYCGKQKLTKQLRDTIRDPDWEYSNLPEYVDDLLESTDLERFGTARPSRPHSRALQRQLSLLRGDRQADYFLFDEVDRPVRFEARGEFTKALFRALRSACGTVEPGLSRKRILAQLGREYVDDVADKMVKWQVNLKANGVVEGTTFVEMAVKEMTSTYHPESADEDGDGYAISLSFKHFFSCTCIRNKHVFVFGSQVFTLVSFMACCM
jgi:hypothetical protein